MGQSRTKYSFYNASSALGLTLVNGLLGIVVTHFVILHFGSDFNGLNSTANQIVNVLLMLEGGFTLASNVALFAPLVNGDLALANGILAATRKRFRRIGLAFLVAGAAAAQLYALVVNSALPRAFVAAIVTMAIVPQAVNLFYASTYRVLLQAQQKEYVISLITMLTIGLGHGMNLVMILAGGPMWMVRCVTMVCALANSLLIAGYVERRNSFLDLSVRPETSSIKGTGDVMIQKITGVIYNAVPLVFLTVAPSGGTVLASVYAVYNNVFLMLKSLLHAIIDAPRLAFGQMLTQRERKDIWRPYALYEYCVCIAVCVLLTTAYVMILPFIDVYTRGVKDVTYRDPAIALLMTLTAAIEMLHIPSGHLINMAGKFKVSKYFQTVACAVLLISIVIGERCWGVYGLLCAVLLVAALLAVLEMGYIHIFFFEHKAGELLKMLLPLVLAGVVLGICETGLPLRVDGYLSFIGYGALVTAVNGILVLSTAMLFERERVRSILSIARSVLGRG